MHAQLRCCASDAGTQYARKISADAQFHLTCASRTPSAPCAYGEWLPSSRRLDPSRQVIAKSAANVHFMIDTPGNPGPDETLEVPDLRHQLDVRQSPFVEYNNFGGGFVYEDDRVAINSMYFSNPNTSGAGCGSGMTNEMSETAARESSLDLEDMDLESADGLTERVCVPLPPWAVRAGARENIYFNPSDVQAAIVTCGGLCPGLNDVVQGIVNKLSDYGVPDGQILGIKYGYRGFYDKTDKPIVLTKEGVEGIQLQGGTILGTSRGGADLEKIVKQIDLMGLDMLFVVGGNGGNAGASALQTMCAAKGVICSIIGIPKSIDNDILLIDKCFGFDTAVDTAQEALLSAKVESSSALNGIGIVKLMGRSSGFIAMQASLASGVVDVCLIPEVKFDLQGEHGLLAYVQSLLDKRGHCVVCIAEGAGQELLQDTKLGKDASGNTILADVGPWLRDQLKKACKGSDVKYIDPSYIIRTTPTISSDRIYCRILAHNAVHGAFAGLTGVMVGLVSTHYVYLPIPTVISSPRTVDPNGKMYARMRAAIGQPKFVPQT